MKKVLLIMAFFAMIATCSAQKGVKPYYQIYKTAPTIDNIDVTEKNIKYDDVNCTITYYFWAENGESGFVFYNKTSENIYIHLDECFYVANGFAYDYYKNRVYKCETVVDDEEAMPRLKDEPFDYSNGSSQVDAITRSENPLVCVPSHTKKIIREYCIKNFVYRNEEIFLFPGKKDANSMEFTKAETPFTFGNIIAYSVGETEEMKDIIIRTKHEFYVTSVANYSESRAEEVLNNPAPDSFYVPYFKTKEENDKH